jgi:alcohol dehydrogenase
MKAAVLEALGIDNLRVKDLPDPVPGPGEVLVRMRAASLNYRDLVAIDGGYGSKQKQRDLIVLSDGAGEIAAVGDGVRGFAPGDRVVASFFRDFPGGGPTAAKLESAFGARIDGVACEYRALPAAAVLHAPPHLTWTEAAALPCAGVTGWSAVVADTHTKAGDVVVTQGSGGVALFALQFAVMAGARVIATSSTDAKLARLRELGAAELINYRALPEWGRRVTELTGGVGADLVVEIGGAASLKQSLLATRVGGTVAMIGVVSGARTELNLGPVVTRHVRMQGITVGSRERFADMLRAMSLHGMKPVLDRVFPLADVADALRYLKSGQHFGKVCIEI